ncbi:MAG: protein kinase domain-containing protein [Candidatus Longimicrobiales bacterium M2_2A_002]
MSEIIDRLNAALEGRYRILEELGEGGMATVFLAHDVKHDRKVALKVLKPELAAVVGADRFLTEIRTTANLQHPNILPLFDSGEADTFLYYVMPYIEGESLREKLQRDKQLSVDEAVGIINEVAEALEAAHAQGIIHRDIKPANILLSAGRPLVADFGIALAVSQAGGERITETGLSLGTPYYMSPEQATGDRVPTPASDVYGLGCVLYEMLTGDPPHTGATAQAVLGKILLGSPTRATELRPAVPPHIDGALMKALEKLPADRFDSASAFARALQNPSFRYGNEDAVVEGGAGGPWKGVAAAAVAAAVALAGGLAWSLTRPAPEPVTRQVLAPFARGTAYDRPLGALTALAPDGSSMVYAEATDGGWRLVLKRRGSAEATPLPGTEDARVPTYSPDGQEIAWVSGQELKKRPIEGGAVLTLARDADVGMAGVSWADDGTILYERNQDNALMRIPSTGGEPGVIRAPAGGDTLIAWTQPLPGSRAVLVEMCPSGNCGTSQLLTVVELATGDFTVLADEVLRAWWVPTGHVVYVRRDGTVWAAPFDLGTLTFDGAAVPLFENVATGLSFPEMALGADGTLLYIEGPASSASGGGRELVWVTRDGTTRGIPGMAPGLYQEAVLSPDGDRLAIIQGPEGPGAQLWVKELPEGPVTRLTDDPGYTRRPAWSPDGEYIAYVTQDTGGVDQYHARRIAADGSSLEPETLLDADQPILEIEYTPDGEGVVVRLGVAETGTDNADVAYVDLAGSGEMEMLLGSSYAEYSPAVSPDGRWLAYVSEITGSAQVFVRPFRASGGSRTQVSTGTAAAAPVWSRSGGEIFFVDFASGTLWVAAVDGGGEDFRVESRGPLFQVQNRVYAADLYSPMYDPGLDGQEFIMVGLAGFTSGSGPQAETTGRYILVQNWFTELEAQLEAARNRAQ